MEEASNPNNADSNCQNRDRLEDFDCGDSACSTPFVSAPSSPTRDPIDVSGGGGGGFFFSAPASPSRNGELDFDFDFSARFPPAATATASVMSSADELFHNGQIRPVRLSSLLLRPQALPPLLDVAAGEVEDRPEPTDVTSRGRELRLRSRSIHRKSRSLSPLRNPFHWPPVVGGDEADKSLGPDPDTDPKHTGESEPSIPAAASRSSSSSSSSSTSSSRSSKKWVFLKELLHRSKSDGGGSRGERRFFSFSKEKEKDKTKQTPVASTPPASATATRSPSPTPSPARGRGRRRTAAERMYEARRAEVEEMRRRTALPYRPGQGMLLGCLGFRARGYYASGAMNGLARGLNATVSSRS